MPHFVVKTIQGNYAYPRAATGEVYKSRIAFGSDLNKARVFNNKSAARNSVNKVLYEDEYEVVPVHLTPMIA